MATSKTKMKKNTGTGKKNKPKRSRSTSRKKKLTPDQLREENLEFFKNNIPGMFKILDRVTPLSELVWLDNGEADIVFRNTYLYNKLGADTDTKEGLKKFYDNPYRLAVGSEAGAVDEHGLPIMQRIVERSNEKSLKFSQKFTTDKCYFLFVLGVGLGKHLAPLIKKYQPKYISIFEPNKEFLFHSLSVIDWTEVFDAANKAGAVIDFAPGDSPDAISKGIADRLRGVCPPAADGTVIYRHYANSNFEAGIKDLQNNVLKTTLMGLGFFEDDMNMIMHSYQNLYPGTAKIMQWMHGQRKIQTPVFILGNGPSLDSHFDYIRENQGRVIIISCGTALDPVLDAGITPDFHIQIERDISNYELYKMTSKSFDISTINLVASTTIYPKTSELFNEIVYFFRPGLSSLPLFMTEATQSLPLPDPSVVNTALSFALHADFSNFYFFGCDMGAKSKEYHHAKKSVYHDDGRVVPSAFDKEKMKKLTDSFKIPLPGNFGGTVLTHDILLWSKNMLEALIKMKGSGHFFYNCSDGAFIEGTRPKRIDSIQLDDIPGGKSALIDQFIQKFPEYTESMFDQAWEKADLLHSIETLADALIDIFKRNRSLSSKKYLKEIMQLFQPSKAESAPAMLFRGSFMLYLAACEWFLNRMASEKERMNMGNIVRQESIKYIDELRAEAIERFEAMIEEQKEVRS